MDKKSVFAAIIGVLLYVLVIYLASIQRDLSIHQLILILATPLVMGILSGAVKMGLVLGFIVSLVMLVAEALILQSEVFANPNMIAAVFVMSLPFVLLSAALGAAGGLIGRRVFRK